MFLKIAERVSKYSHLKETIKVCGKCKVSIKTKGRQERKKEPSCKVCDYAKEQHLICLLVEISSI